MCGVRRGRGVPRYVARKAVGRREIATAVRENKSRRQNNVYVTVYAARTRQNMVADVPLKRGTSTRYNTSRQPTSYIMIQVPAFHG